MVESRGDIQIGIKGVIDSQNKYQSKDKKNKKWKNMIKKDMHSAMILKMEKQNEDVALEKVQFFDDYDSDERYKLLTRDNTSEIGGIKVPINSITKPNILESFTMHYSKNIDGVPTKRKVRPAFPKPQHWRISAKKFNFSQRTSSK
jgi:hypothetical protein